MNSSKRWTFRLKNTADAAPQGLPDSFERAVNALGAHGSHEDGKDCTCVECARKAVQGLAVAYNTYVILSVDAPRATDVLREIDEIRTAAETLRNALLSMNDFTREAFEKHGALKGLPRKSYYGPRTTAPDCVDADSEWIQELSSLLRAAIRTSVGFTKARAESTGQLVDKGGNTNLFKEDYKPAEYNLVVDGWNLFQKFRPNEAKGREGSCFHQFALDVYEYATGRDAEDYSGVTSWMKALARPLRKLDQLIAQREEIYRDLKNTALDPDTKLALNKKLAFAVYKIAFQQQFLLDFRRGKKPHPNWSGS